MTILLETYNASLSSNEHQVITIHSPKYGTHNVLLDLEDYLALQHFSWCYTSKGYVVTKVKTNNSRKATSMHRCVMELMLGRELVEGEVVDHLNRNKLDNRRVNLRLTDQKGNSQNRSSSPGSSSKYVGVCWEKGRSRWKANLRFNRKLINGGYFIYEHFAALAYDVLARATGEVKAFNFPDICLTMDEIKKLDKSLI